MGPREQFARSRRVDKKLRRQLAISAVRLPARVGTRSDFSAPLLFLYLFDGQRRLFGNHLHQSMVRKPRQAHCVQMLPKPDPTPRIVQRRRLRNDEFFPLLGALLLLAFDGFAPLFGGAGRH
jgi:hypothetical protein